MRFLFIGSNGIRAGWRVLIYLAMVAPMAATAHIVSQRFFPTDHHGPATVISAVPVLISDGLVFAFLLIAALVMSRIERRPMGSYGLPLTGVVRSRVWTGGLIGLASLTAVLGAIALARHAAFTLAGPLSVSLLVSAGLYALAFISVASAEEYLFRGYPLATLTQGIGFWPAALVLSALFALAHATNGGESLAGLAQVMIFSLVLCYSVLATGNLWFALGYHAAWDWGETFFYGVPDSGTVASASVMHGTLFGPAWLTGGADGPEGSVLTTLALLALIPLLWQWRTRDPHPHDRYARP